MKVIKAILSAVVLLNLLNGCSGQLNQVEPLHSVKADTVGLSNRNLMVKIKPGLQNKFLQLAGSLQGIENVKVISEELNLAALKTNGNTLSIRDSLKKSLLTEYIEEDIIFNFNPGEVQYHSDKNFSIKAGQDSKQWPLSKINTPENSENVFNHEVKIAVIDTGVDSNHPALRGSLLPMIDIWNEEGWDDTYQEKDIKVNYRGKDGNGHGTHIAGIINNVAAYSGNRKIKILPLKAFNHQGRTSTGVLTKAVLKAVEKGADVINLSMGGPSSEEAQALQEAITLASSKGIVIVSSVGNSSRREKGKIRPVTIPAAYPEVISVGALNRNGLVSDYSNSGPEIDIMAPGGENIANDDSEKVTSAWPVYPTFEEYKNGVKGPEASLAGTSMACPYVSAAAALLLSKNNKMNPAQVRLRLLSTADDIYATGFDESTGYGRLNLAKALRDDDSIW